MVLQSIALAIDQMQKKFDYSHKAELLKEYCECIKLLTEAYALIASIDAKMNRKDEEQ
jgi:hypothetical protein